MRVQDEIGAFVKSQCHAFRFNVRDGPGLPEEQVTIRVEDLRLDPNLHSSETGARLGFAPAGGSFAIDKNVGVVHVALVAGTNLNRLHPTRFLNRHRENEIPIGVGA